MSPVPNSLNWVTYRVLMECYMLPSLVNNYIDHCVWQMTTLPDFNRTLCICYTIQCNKVIWTGEEDSRSVYLCSKFRLQNAPALHYLKLTFGKVLEEMPPDPPPLLCSAFSSHWLVHHYTTLPAPTYWPVKPEYSSFSLSMHHSRAAFQPGVPCKLNPAL